MSGMYDETNFHSSIIPSYLKKDVREVIETAVMFGWKMHLSGSNSVTIISHGERRKYHFSASGRASNSLTRIKRDIIKFADPEKLQIADSILGIKNQDLATLAMALLPKTGDAGTVVDHRPELAEQKQEQERQKQEQRKVTVTPKAMPQKAAPVLVAKDEARHIVSEKPMVAKASEGVGYESKVAIERTWSDGTTDYKCVECDYTTEKRLGVRSHFVSHRKKTAPPPRFKTEVPNAATYKPNRNRVAALAEFLMAEFQTGVAMDDKAQVESLARDALTWVHEQSKKGTPLAGEREEMSEEDILTRIRALLDDGTQLAAMNERDEKIATLEARLEQAEMEALAAAEKASKAEATLNTFIELATELRTSKE